MLHLLTEEHKKKIVREYHLRVLTIVSSGVVIVFIASAVFLIPSYVVSFGKYSEVAANKKSLDIQITAKQSNSSAQDVKEISSTLGVIKQYTLKVQPSHIFERILKNKPSGISITNFAYTPSQENEVTVDISGVASTRANLSAFNEMLKNEKVFSGVSIPLSSFAKERNINFSIKMLVSLNEEAWSFNSPEQVLEIEKKSNE